MASTFGSIAESQVTVDTTITSIISEVQDQRCWEVLFWESQVLAVTDSPILTKISPAIFGEESVADPEETAKKKIKALDSSMSFLAFLSV